MQPVRRGISMLRSSGSFQTSSGRDVIHHSGNAGRSGLMSCGTRFRLHMLPLSGHRKLCMFVIRRMRQRQKIADSSGNICSENGKCRRGTSRQTSYRPARAQKTLEGRLTGMKICLHKNWDLATDEQKARILQIKANTERMKSSGNDDGEDGVVDCQRCANR